MKVYRAVRDARSIKRLQEDPEKEVPRLAQRGTIRMAQKLLAGDPALRKVYADVRAYQQVRAKESALQSALRTNNGAESKLKQIPELKQRAERLSKAFDQEWPASTVIHRQPAKLSNPWRRNRVYGKCEAMKSRPEQFGQIISEERKKWLGLATETNRNAAYQAARSAAEVGGQYLQAKTQVPSKSERTIRRLL